MNFSIELSIDLLITYFPSTSTLITTFFIYPQRQQASPLRNPDIFLTHYQWMELSRASQLDSSRWPKCWYRKIIKNFNYLPKLDHIWIDKNIHLVKNETSILFLSVYWILPHGTHFFSLVLCVLDFACKSFLFS